MFGNDVIPQRGGGLPLSLRTAAPVAPNWPHTGERAVSVGKYSLEFVNTICYILNQNGPMMKFHLLVFYKIKLEIWENSFYFTIYQGILKVLTKLKF